MSLDLETHKEELEIERISHASGEAEFIENHTLYLTSDAPLRAIRSLPALPVATPPMITHITPPMLEATPDHINQAIRDEATFWRNWENYLDLNEIFAASEEAVIAMHRTPMKNHLFDDWYQEWSRNAERAGVNEDIKSYAFRKNLNQLIHTRILRVSPQPTTITELAKLARAFDQAYHASRSKTITNESHHDPRNLTPPWKVTILYKSFGSPEKNHIR
jgi:hypothetical protein